MEGKLTLADIYCVNKKVSAVKNMLKKKPFYNIIY